MALPELPSRASKQPPEKKARPKALGAARGNPWEGTEIRERNEQRPTTNPVPLGSSAPPREGTQAGRALTSLGDSVLPRRPTSRSHHDSGWDPKDGKPGPFDLNIGQKECVCFSLPTLSPVCST